MRTSPLFPFLLPVIAFAVLSASAQDRSDERTRPDPALDDAVKAQSGIPFARYGDREIALDLYRPAEKSGPLPAIICIHGGGWFKGTRANMRNLARALAARGFVTASISYRLSGEAEFPAAIHDAKAAVRFLRAEADTLGIDSDAIGVTGLSAGGHLAALLTTSGDVEELEGDGGNAERSSRVQAGIAMGAQSDFLTERIGTLSATPGNPHYTPFLGGTQEEIPETYRLASPRHHIDRNDPPLLFLTGELDDPSTHADGARDDLEKLGIPTGLTVFPGAPHAFLGRQRAFDAAVDVCDEFFSKHLKGR